MTHPPSNIVKNPSWWRKRTRLERALMIAVGTAAIFLVVFAALLTCMLHKEQQEMQEPLPTMSALNKSEDEKTLFNRKNEPELCLEEGCIHAASQILSQMDKNAEPCDDFYQFACGQFRKKFIPDDKTSITAFSVISDKLDEQLREILSEPVSTDEIVPIQNAKQLYNLCMNESKIEEYGIEPVLNLFKKLGGWPVLEENSWDPSGSWQWRETLYTFRKNGFGADYFIDFSVIPDLKNSTNRILNYDQALLGLSREYLVKGMDHKRVKAYYNYMVDIAVLFQADRQMAEKQLLESLQLEMKLAEISLPREERRDSNKLYNLMTIGEMMLKFPSIPWREYTNNLLPEVLKVTDDEPVIVSVPKYITDLEKILEQTPKRVLANYLMWRVAVSTVSYLPQRFRDRQLKYSTLVSGTKTRQPRWMECSDLATRSISLAVGSLYVQRNFDKNAKAKALDLVDRVREEVYKTLETIDWMDDKTRKAAIEKAHSITTHIGYPDELLDQNKIVDFYRGLEIDGNGPYLDVILNMTKFGTNYTLSRLREKINKTDWISHSRAPVVNAYYSPLENSIQFPAGILQGVFFSDKRPNYMNFGTIGYVIGHEITHGFDDQGKQFDKDGDLNDWWEKETEDKYKEKARCIIEQYGNFTAKQVNLKLSGVNTQGENIADNGGVKFAYKAYESWVKDLGEEPRLPGLQQYSPSQMFWISVASSWCNAYRSESLSNLITTGYHSPGEFRVNGPLSNTPAFARDFNCPSGSPMNPSKKCEVW